MAGDEAPLARAGEYDNLTPQRNPTQTGEGAHIDAAAEDLPTDSHALAATESDEKGYAQTDPSTTTVRDLDWHNDSCTIPIPSSVASPTMTSRSSSSASTK
jgi:hypothetical protein